MGKTVELSQLAFLQNFSTEFSTLGDDYVFTRITESDRRPGDFSGGPVRFDGMSWLLCFGGRLDIEVNLEDIGSIDELTYVIVLHYDVCCDDTALVIDLNEFLTRFESAVERKFNDGAAVDDCGDLAFCAEGLGGFLAEVCTGFGCQLKYFHLCFC